MTLRVTRQMIEVVGQKTSKIRINRLSIQVLMANVSESLEHSASNALSLGGVATFNIERGVSAASEIVLVGVAAAGEDKPVSADSAISLAQEAIAGQEKEASAASAMSLSSTAIGIGPIKRSLSSVATLTQTLDYAGPKPASAASALAIIDQLIKHNVYLPTPTQTLTLQSTATQNLKYLLAANSLSLAQIAQAAQPILVEADSEIIFEQTLANNVLLAVASNAIGLEQVVIFQKNTDFNLNASSALGLTVASTRGQSIYNRSAPDTLGIPGTDDFLNLVGTVYLAGDRLVSAANTLNLASGVGVKQAVINQTVASIMSFLIRAGLTYDRSAASVLSLDGVVERKHTPENILQLVQVAQGAVAKYGTSVLTLQGVVTRAMDYLRYVVTPLALTQYVNPWTGATPCASPYGTATLTLISGLTSLELKNPEFGNILRVIFSRINRVSRGGSLIVYSDPLWPKQKVMAVQVDGLKEEQKVALMDFLKTTVGQEVQLKDHENRTHTGVILTPDAEITHVGRDNYSISFEFEAW